MEHYDALSEHFCRRGKWKRPQMIFSSLSFDGSGISDENAQRGREKFYEPDYRFSYALARVLLQISLFMDFPRMYVERE
jgi:hypothetical protein